MAEETITAQEHYEQRRERKINLAGQRDTRVVFARTPDTHQVLNITSAADRGIRILRNRAGMSRDYSPEEVFALIGEFHNAVYQLHKVTEKICTKADINYRPPRNMEELDKRGNGHGTSG
jgi:hypothetical protein